MRALAAFILLFAVACATPAPEAGARRTIDIAAEQWVRLALEIDTHDEGFVDAYYGPAEWRDQARANPRTAAELTTALDTLTGVLADVARQDTDQTSRRRTTLMIASIASARLRLEMVGGRRVPFVAEAEQLFSLTPTIRPLSYYDPIIARLEASVPGRGSLADRISAFNARYGIPADRAQAVMEAAIAECRRRTAQHMTLPENESFRMEFVTGQSWSAYNYYQGDSHSLIQINMDRGLSVDSVLTLACHEGYPGHHVQGIYAERLYRERGWVEYSVAPLYNPNSPLAEGGGNYGVEMAFPGAERVAYERDVIYPLAGLDPSTAQAYADMRVQLAQLRGVRLTIAQQYLDGEITRAQAAALLQRYQFASAASADQTLRFADHYRSYLINYVSGEEIVGAYVERAGTDRAARWAAFESLLTNPRLPRELTQ